MTLVRFLLARIAEDEAWWRDRQQTEPKAPELLADCDAKRRIVEDYLDLDRQYWQSHSEFTEARRFQALVAVGQLGTSYAYHADYDETWRP